MPTICLDFDGVVHSYTTRWAGPGVIADPPTEGAKEFCEWALGAGYEVTILSTRSFQEEGLAAMHNWLKEHGFPEEVQLAADKPPAILYVDDRGFRFEGKWDDVKEILASPNPWNKR